MSDAATPETPNRGILTLCVMLATIMQALDTTIANVALPYMQGNLSATQDQINWVLTSYIVAAAIMTPMAGWLSGRFGRKQVFLVAVAGFTVASMLCGTAESLTQMVIWRLLLNLKAGTNLNASSTFGRIREARPMRQVQLGLRLSF